jgi:integrase
MARRRPIGKRSVALDGAVRVHGKAGNGEGSVYFTKDGRWRATYWVLGGSRPRSVSAPTREKAVAKRAEVLEELARMPAQPSAMSRNTTIGDLAEWWLENVHRHQVRASTWTKAEDRVRRIVATLGRVQVRKLHVEQIVTWQSGLLKTLAPKTVGHHRQTLAQVMDQAVELGLIAANPVRRVKAPRVPRTSARALTVDETRALVAAASSDPYGAVVALLFFQGWRVSEALGLAWGDVDLDAAAASVRRACIYIDHQGPALGPTKTAGAMGDHQLVPTVVELLRRRRAQQAADRLASEEPWPERVYEGRVVDLVFTTPTGGLLTRQSITKLLNAAAETAGIDATKLGTHTGRRSVVTALYAEAGESIEEIARFVGHASAVTTAGYVRDLGNRPAAFAERAARLLDPAASEY